MSVRGRRRSWPAEETSAGGLVVDTAGGHRRAALIGRLDRHGTLLWSLPKGHVERGEAPEETAIREIAEETGILGRVVAPLGIIDYWFAAGGGRGAPRRRVHKTVHHFLLLAVGGSLSAADVEVSEVAWVPLPELGDRLAYPDERRLVLKVPALLAGTA
jgi:8-oxo-dGTP pyrophosphatase MutT (NUDIX family)